MNIAILIGRFPPHDTGDAERLADHSATLLAARGHGVTVITRRWRGRPAWERRDGYAIMRTPIALNGPSRSLLDLGATLAGYRRIHPRPDLTLAFQTFASGWTAGFIDVLQRVPSVVWVQGEDEYRFDLHPERYNPSVFAWRQARRVLLPSARQREALLDQVRRRDPLRADRLSQRMIVVGSALDLPPAATEAASWELLGTRLEQVLSEVAVRSPRVWIVSPNPSSRGGIAAVARQIATSRLSRRFRISMLPTHTPGSMPARMWRGGLGILQVLCMITLRKPDLVHIKVASGGSFVRKLIVGAICRARRVPVLAHVHGGGFDQFLTRSPWWVGRLARWWFSGTAQVLTLSDRWAERLKPIFPRATMSVLPNPIEVARFDDLAVARFALPVVESPQPREAPRMALFLGDILPRKGVFDLVAAWADVVREFPGARLVIAGTGQLDQLRAAAEAAGVAQAIDMPGWVEFEAKRKLLAEADVFVLPSYIEGVPISLLEAMASGLPSVVTPVGGVLDTVDDGREVLIVPTGDREALARAILAVFADPAFARRMGEAARRRAAEYDIDVYVDKLGAIYDRIIARA